MEKRSNSEELTLGFGRFFSGHLRLLRIMLDEGAQGVSYSIQGCVDSSPLIFLLKFDYTYYRPFLKTRLLDGLDSRPGINKLGSLVGV